MLQQAVGGDDLMGKTVERRVRGDGRQRGVRVDKGVTTGGRWRRSYGKTTDRWVTRVL